MAVPATSTFNPNRGRVVQLALTDVGALGPGSVSPGADAAPLIAHANDLLNMLIKSMDRDGVLGWRSVLRTLAVTGGVSTYVLPSEISDIDPPARYTLAGQTAATVCTPMVNNEWMALGDRTLTGTPIRYYLSQALDATGLLANTLSFFPVPQTNDSFEYEAVIKARDAGSDADTLDIPQKWLRCLRFGLALDLSPGYGLPMDRVGFFQQMFNQERDACLNDDQTHADIQMIPFGAYYYGGQGGRI